MDCRFESQSKKITGFATLFLALLLVVSAGVWAADRLELDETAIKGTRELPKVLYIVPWKNARLDALSGGAGSASFDTAWEPLDRNVFRRQVKYYEILYGGKAE
jgi:hypothetical protein